MTDNNTLILIPSRYESSRFPGKPLTKIAGKSMIQRVYESCLDSGFDTCVVTDNQEIEDHVKSFGKVVRIDDDVPSGSERIALAVERYFSDTHYEFVINVQGDEPLIKGKELVELISHHGRTNFDISTLVKKRSSTEEDFANPDVVKALFNELNHQCFYFSRASIPFNREGGESDWYQHIGVYSYRTLALKKFVRYPFSSLENIEKLEQLRALQNGQTIGARLTTMNLIGVDRPEDVEKVEHILRGENE